MQITDAMVEAGRAAMDKRGITLSYGAMRLMLEASMAVAPHPADNLAYPIISDIEKATSISFNVEQLDALVPVIRMWFLSGSK